jgi:hypothetical protein
MLRLLADENFNNVIVRGLQSMLPETDVTTVQWLGMDGALDPAVLEWAAANEWVLLTHDWRTMPGHVRDRLVANKLVWGVLVVPTLFPCDGRSRNSRSSPSAASLPTGETKSCGCRCDQRRV